MGNGVQREDGGERPVDICLEFLQGSTQWATLLHFGFGKRWRDAEQHSFPDRTEEGEDNRNEKEQAERIHVSFDGLVSVTVPRPDGNRSVPSDPPYLAFGS